MDNAEENYYSTNKDIEIMILRKRLNKSEALANSSFINGVWVGMFLLLSVSGIAYSLYTILS